MTAANVVSYLAQIALLVLACAALPRILGVRSPAVQYLFWRVLLAVCLLLPAIEPWRHEIMAFVPAPAALATTAVLAPPADAPAVARSAASVATVLAILLLVGIAARLAWLSAGVIRLQHLRNRASERAGGFGDLRQTIGVAADIYWSADVRHPVAFGILRPIVLLPIGLKSADTAAQRAVVAHELHHVRRGDWAWVVAEEIVRSIFWFHPGMWWLVSRVQLARETVVDELSIRTTNARRAYLDTLLAFADDTALAPTPAFSARRHLFHRVMLLSKEGRMSPLRIAVGSCVLVGALGIGSWGVVRAFPLASVIVVPDVVPPQSAIRDAAARHAVERWNKAKDSSLPREQRLRLIEMSILEVDHALSIDPNYRDALVWKDAMLRLEATLTDHDEARALMLHQADELRDRVLALMKQSPAAAATRTTPGQLPPPPPPPAQRDLPRSPDQYMPPPPPPAPSAAPQAAEPPMPAEFKAALERLKPVLLGPDASFQPTVKKHVEPVYPDEARAAGLQGRVELEAIIDTDGNVAAVRVLHSMAPFDEAATDAAKQWVFTPALVNGTPTAVRVKVEMTFTIR